MFILPDGIPIHHKGNPDYNEVVLHVVLYHNGQRGIKRQDGRIVPEWNLPLY